MDLFKKGKTPSDNFMRLFAQFSDRTRDAIDYYLTLTLEILSHKYTRKKSEYEETLRRRKNKKKINHNVALLLKEKDISNAMILIDFHINSKTNINVNDLKELMMHFGKFPLEDATRWYDEYLVKSTIRDVMGRRIVFTENGKKFLYKEKSKEGKHIVAPENYAEPRGKRLFWIKYILPRTREIYRQVEPSWETFLYVGNFKIQIEKDTQYESIVDNYFLIVTRRNAGKPLEFVTAYFMDKKSDLFKRLERARPLTLEQQTDIREKEKKY